MAVAAGTLDTGGARGPRVGFLAPEGTFTHETALMAAEQLAWVDPQFVPYLSGAEAVRAASRGEVDYAVVGVATSLNGPIAAEMGIVAESGLTRITDIQRVCHYHLLALPGANLALLTAIRSNPKALADCRVRLEQITPGVPHERTPSTAAAVQSVAEEGRTDVAAVGTAAAARRYGLVPLAENIEDDPDNWTRWTVVAALRTED